MKVNVFSEIIAGRLGKRLASVHLRVKFVEPPLMLRLKPEVSMTEISGASILLTISVKVFALTTRLPGLITVQGTFISMPASVSKLTILMLPLPSISFISRRKPSRAHGIMSKYAMTESCTAK